jgi:DNA-binding NtrC family response regulator
MSDRAEVLLVEDERALRELFVDVLTAAGHEVVARPTLTDAAAFLAAHQPDLVLLDVKLPDGDGLEFLARQRAAGLRVPVVVMTAFGTLDRAVQALKAGAVDFLVKPFDNARLVSAVGQGLEGGARLEELEFAAGTVGAEGALSAQLIGAEGGLRDVAALLPRVASSDATVLLRGESGTGKEVVARALHAASPRLDGPFVAINCAALPPSLLEAELFGFERGAFTGAHAARKGLVEQADGGTLFLDEIGDMSAEAQGRLLRVLQEREVARIGGRAPVKVDIRVIAATHRDLAAMAAQGTFRSDLLYRLNVVPIALPPLRDRRQDIPGLIEHFLEKHERRLKRSGPRPTAELLRQAQAHAWPGNVRELENAVERAVVLGHFELPGAAPAPLPTSPSPAPAASPRKARTLREAVAEAERAAVVDALREAGGNKAEAARLLGVSYKTLFNKLHEHAIREETVVA